MPPRCTTRAVPTIGPGSAGRRKLTFSSRVGANWSGSRVATSAGPIVSSSIAARKPPWIAPTGLVNSTRASKQDPGRAGIRIDLLQLPTERLRGRRRHDATRDEVPERTRALLMRIHATVIPHGTDNHRADRTQWMVTQSSRDRSSWLSRSAPAAMFSSRWMRSPVPGIASTCGPRCRVHASRTCCGVAPRASAIARMVSACSAVAPASRPPPAIAKNGTNATSRSPHA